jgi:GAF domain-containing protein
MEPSPDRSHVSPAPATLAATIPASKDSASTDTSNVRFPGSGGEHSLAEMARRDLDAALQLLADRAQYITGASGAAIALRRNGKKDMQCRASTGSNAPELGALLSTEFGLSGESVRTRQPLRCDDAERDVRVNREVCRQLGIASVVVMPVVNDEGVLGVFELFSGEVNAFGERDLSAVQRLSEMVETAVRLAEAAESFPERLWSRDIGAAPGLNEDKVLGGEVLEELVQEGPVAAEIVAEELVLEEIAAKEPVAEEESGTEKAGLAPGNEAVAERAAGTVSQELPEKISASSAGVEQVRPSEVAAGVFRAMSAEQTLQPPQSSKDSGELREDEELKGDGALKENQDKVVLPSVEVPPVVSQKFAAPENLAAGLSSASALTEPKPDSAQSVESGSAKRQLFWTAAPNLAEAGKAEEADQSHVPPVLRDLRKCEACGFPVSAGRALCVECEEKKWNGKLRVSGSTGPKQRAKTASVAAVPSPGAATVSAAVQRSAALEPVSATSTSISSSHAVQRLESAAKHVIPDESTLTFGGQTALESVSSESSPSESPVFGISLQSSTRPAQSPSSEFAFSAGLERPESWLSANKYVIGVLAAAIVVVIVLLLR